MSSRTTHSTNGRSPVRTRVPAGNRSSKPVTVGRLNRWLAALPPETLSPPVVQQAVAWAHALTEAPALAQSPQAEHLRARLSDIAQQAQSPAADISAAVRQMATAEIPLLLAQQMPADPQRKSRVREAVATLERGLQTLVDEEGCLYAEHLSQAWELLACWTRCRQLAGRESAARWSAAALRRFRLLLRYLLRALRPDGGLPLTTTPRDAKYAAQHVAALQLAIELAGDAGTRRLAAAAFAPPRKRRSSKASQPKEHTAAMYSPRAATAILRPNWSADSPRLAVFYREPAMALELALGSDVVLAGTCLPQVAIDGVLLGVEDTWRSLCWVSDADVDYLEIELQLTHDVRIQRQIALARRDRVLWLADAVLGEKPGEWEYRGELPLAPRVRLDRAKETRDVRLTAGRSQALVLPLSLGEWSNDAASGEFAATRRELQITHRQRGRRLHAAWFIDLAPPRRLRALTWRHLTVGENRQVLPADVARGYRVQIEDRQWLYYRALGPKGNRTVLGHNLVTESLFGRFTADGTVDKLIEIQ